MGPRAYQDRRLLWSVLLLALLLRAGWGLSRSSAPASIDALPDQREYLSLADNLLHGRGLGFYDARFQAWVVAYRMPGYPLLLAACGGVPRLIRVVQALLDTSTVLAVWLLALRCLPATFRDRGAIIAALLAAVNPFLIYFSGLILSETLFVAMLIWGMWLLLRCEFASRTIGRIVLALSILVRPSALLLPIILAVVAPFAAGASQNSQEAATYHRRWQWRHVAASVGWMIVWIGAACLPWALRNHQPTVLGHWVLLTTNGGVTAYDGMNPQADGSSNQMFLRDMPELRAMDEISRSNYLQHRAEQYARSNPMRAVELAGLKMARTWSPVPLSDSFQGWHYRLVALLYSGCLDLLALAGLIMGRMSRACKVLLVTPAIYFTAVHALSVGSLRYRLPIEPPMAIMAASVFASILGKRVASTLR